jgi:PBP1b-binding outer membrane lipoprotein LpoB
MQKMIPLATILAALVVLSGCNSNCQTPCSKSAAPTQCHHHDLKGESM